MERVVGACVCSAQTDVARAPPPMLIGLSWHQLSNNNRVIFHVLNELERNGGLYRSLVAIVKIQQESYKKSDVRWCARLFCIFAHRSNRKIPNLVI